MRGICVVSIVVLLVSVAASPATAGVRWDRRADRAVEKWGDTDLGSSARELRERFGLVPTHGSGWSESELEAIEAGAESMPAEFFDRLTTPIFLDRRDRVCSFGQGDGTPGCPRFDSSGRTFYLYDTGEISHRIAERTMPGLEPPERRRLMYRRAVVHLVVAKLDRWLEWSERRAWRTINGWENGEPMNRDWLGYSRPLGRQSPHLDFVTFAEEFFVRPEDLLRDVDSESAKRRLREFEPDDSVACRMMTRSRYMRRVTHEITDDWSPPKRVNHAKLDGDWNVAGTGCPSFEQWADFEHVERLEFVYASASSEHPESLFGHLLLHVAYGPGADVFREGFEPIYQFGAVTGTEVTSVGYFLKGLFGGFPSVLDFNTLRASRRIYLRYERRNLRTYRLRLTRDQRIRVLQRTWEAQRHLRYPYFFFQNNCASFVVDFFRPVLGTELQGLPSIAVMPVDVLDAFAATENPELEGEKSFLQQRYRSYLSSEIRAAKAIERRRALAGRIGPLGSNGSAGTSFDAIHRRVESMQPGDRRGAYERVKRHLANGVEPEAARDLVDYLFYSSVVERYFVERARFARLERLAQQSQQEVNYTIQDRLQVRREIYRIDDLQERLKAWSDRMQERISPLAAKLDHSGRPSKRTRRLRKTYLASLNALSSAIDRSGREWSGRDFMRSKEQRRRARHYTRQREAIGPSGAWRGSVGFFGARGELPAGSTGVRESRAGFELHTAFLRDEFGEFRVRGLRPQVESRSFDLELQSWLTEQWQRRLRAEMILYRFYTLETRPGPMSDSWRDGVGWGLDSGVRHDGARGLHFGGWLSGGLILPLFQSEIGTDYLAWSIFADSRGDIAREGALLLGGRSFLRGQMHLGGNYGNVARLKLETHQYSSLQGDWEYEASASLSTRHLLGDATRRPLWLVPFLEGRYSSLDYTDSPTLYDLRAGLRFDFPL